MSTSHRDAMGIVAAFPSPRLLAMAAPLALSATKQREGYEKRLAARIARWQAGGAVRTRRQLRTPQSRRVPCYAAACFRGSGL